MNKRVILFLKASTPAGARWITVHPHGRDEKGVPVMIQPQADGSAKVIGGAGGSLNHLRLTGVKSEAEYKTEAANKSKERRAVQKEQRQADKEAGLTTNKGEAREHVRTQVGAEEAAFVKEVADAYGWSEEDTRFPEELAANLTDTEYNAAVTRHARELVRRAEEAVDGARKVLVQDAEARSAAGLGEVPLTTASDDEISAQDLAPVADTGKGLGFAPKYDSRARQAGLTDDDLAAEANAARGREPATEQAKNSPKQRGEAVAKELEAIRDRGPVVDPARVLDAERTAKLLKAAKKLKAARKAAQGQMKLINGAKERVEPKAYVIEASEASDEDVAREVENDVRTLRTRGFLDEVGKIEDQDGLGRHVAAGAFNSVNALALAAGGAAMLDRSTVDVLGVAGAASVLAARLHADLTPDEVADTLEAMKRFHVDHYMRASDGALMEARRLQEVAAEIELPDAHDGASLAQAQEMNARRREFVRGAQKVLGTAYGEMEANAALVLALGQKPKKELAISLGRASIETGIKQARAIGLDRGDYQVAKAGASTMLTVTADGMAKLARPVSREDMARTRAALDIMEGRRDEDGWLPRGVTSRPEAAMQAKPGTAARIAKPIARNPADVGQAVRDYIGGRAADGDAPGDILTDLLSEEAFQRVGGDRQAVIEAVEQVAPLHGEDGAPVRAEQYAATFDRLADDVVKAQGGARTAFQRQGVAMDQATVEALHTALAKHPEGVLAWKPIGELTPQDQGALRREFAAQYGRTDPAAEGLRQELERLDAAEPEKETDDMFGRAPNPEHAGWKADRDAKAEALGKASMTWGKYLDVMGSPANAYATMQDVVRSKVLRAFADSHNAAKPDAPLKVGRQVIANDLNHLDALDPAARERRVAAHRGLVDRLRNRAAGQYSAGSVSDKLDAARAAEEAQSKAQMGLFGGGGLFDEPEPDAKQEEPAAPAPEKALGLGERYSIGHTAEGQVAAMMPSVGSNFQAGRPAQLYSPNMSGAYVGRQRAVKLIEQNERTGLGLGVGSGKTSILMSGWSNLHEKGKTGRGLFAVPSIVQGQFGGEALALLEPGKYRWHAEPGASREERIAAYKNPDVHFNVVTHQGLRDDLLHLAGKRHGITPDAVVTKMKGMARAERKAFMRDVLDHEGIDHSYLGVDEGHGLLNRAGKEDSNLSMVLDSVSDGMKHYVSATADPVKNDPSEAFDALQKMDPERYHDRDAFLRRYGVDTASSREELRREMARHYYTGQIDPGVKADKREIPVKLSKGQDERLAALDGAAGRARIARLKGGVDVDALRALSPGSFDGADPATHEAIAKRLNASIGILRDAAVQHEVDGEASTDAAALYAHERRGKPGVVFARSLHRVEELRARLEKEGHRVVTITGKDSTKDKSAKLQAYKRREHDVLVASDAAAVGANLQTGKWLLQYDTPQTAMVHAQRRGRINRVGQTADIELADLVPDHPHTRRARKRLADKYELRDITTQPYEGLDDRGIAGFLNRVRSGQNEAAQPLHAPQAPLPKPTHAASSDAAPAAASRGHVPDETPDAHEVAQAADEGQGAMF